MGYINNEQDPSLTQKQVMESQIYKEAQSRYQKEWISNMLGAALFSATITTIACLLPYVRFLNK